MTFDHLIVAYNRNKSAINRFFTTNMCGDCNSIKGELYSDTEYIINVCPACLNTYESKSSSGYHILDVQERFTISILTKE